jgi:hypothetical protein
MLYLPIFHTCTFAALFLDFCQLLKQRNTADYPSEIGQISFNQYISMHYGHTGKLAQALRITAHINLFKKVISQPRKLVHVSANPINRP